MNNEEKCCRGGLLDGVLVLDLTRVLAGPYSSMMLADMGAEVIKLEIPNGGDDTRSMGPFVNGESAYYMNLNRNKKGLTLNLKSAEGKEIFFELVKKADIVLENYRPGTMEKLGLGYEKLKEVNPGIIYGSVSGFGHTGPLSKLAGYDIIGQAYGGLMSTTGWPGGKPTRTGTAMADVLAGLGMTVGVLAALHKKQVSGEGEKVDVALVDSVVSSLEIINMIYLCTGRIPDKIGNRYESSYPYDMFEAKDTYVIIGAGNDKLYKLLAELMERPDIVDDERFNTLEKRGIYHNELREIVEEWTSKYNASEIIKMLMEKGIPTSPVNTIAQVVEDEQVAGAREMFVEVEHPIAGKMKITNSHIKLTEHPAKIKSVSPTLGEHNVEVYKKLLGISQEEVEALKEKGVI